MIPPNNHSEFLRATREWPVLAAGLSLSSSSRETLLNRNEFVAREIEIIKSKMEVFIGTGKGYPGYNDRVGT